MSCSRSLRASSFRVALVAWLVLGCSVLACGSALDIDALGAGGDASLDGDDFVDAGRKGDDEADDTTNEDGSTKPVDGGPGSNGDGSDAGWHVDPGQEDGGPWIATGWKSMTSNSNKDLRAVWGASSTAVWAGGDQGVLLFFNGTTWSARSSSLTTEGKVWAIAGSATDDVYLLELRWNSSELQFQMVLHHYDGASWSEVGPLSSIGEIGCLDVPARGVAYVYGAPKHANTASTANALRLYRVQGATDAGVTSLGSTTYVSDSGYCNVHAIAPNDVWVSGTPVSRYGGAGFSPLPGSPSSDMISVIAPAFAFSRLHVWNGSTWQNQPTGVAGLLLRVTGRSPALAFGIVDGASSHIVRYTNGGWSEDSIPAQSPLLTDIFMAPNGRTFAVGFGGTILSGP